MIRRMERLVLGLAMAIAARVIERRFLRGITRRGVRT
jgi:hypothetical protein